MKTKVNHYPQHRRIVCLFSILALILASFLPLSIPATAASAG